ncbi:hypothetical protein FQN49_001569 [Arthroderma sp. PD_2]|nr:hypothetical protein FQN49_001569 [Arthroderma sp. PD_2]
MAYVQGTVMDGAEMAMGLAAAGPPPPNPPNSNYTNIPLSRPVFKPDEIEEDKEGEEEQVETSGSQNSSEKKPPRLQSRAASNHPENYTSIVPSQSSWSFENLPDVLYIFRGPDRPRGDAGVPLKPSTWEGSPPLRCFSILPDRISSTVEEFRVEAWMRLDRRIQLHDIVDRMFPDCRIVANTLQQRGVRFRQAFSLASWGVSSRQTDKAIDNIRGKLVERGIDLQANTTRGLTPGLVDPRRGEEGGRIPVPAQYKRRKDTTIRRGMAAPIPVPDSIVPALAPVPRMHAPILATNPHANSTARLVSKNPSTATVNARATTPPSVTPTATRSVAGLITPGPSPARVMSAQVLARAASEAIENPHGRCFTAPELTASGEVRSVRAPTIGAAQATLEKAIKNILQEQNRNPVFEDMLRSRSRLMREWRNRFPPNPPHTVFEAVQYLNNWPNHQPMASWMGNTAPTPMLQQPACVSNPERKLLRRVQYTPIKGSSPPRVEKTPARQNGRPRLSPTQNVSHSQSFHRATENANINGVQANSSGDINSYVQTTQSPAARSQSEDLEDEDIEIIDISDDESFEYAATSSIKSEEPNDGRYELDRLDPATVRGIINNGEVGTETEEMEYQPTFDELISIYEHERENNPVHENTAALYEDQEGINENQARLMAEVDRVATQPMDEYFGMTKEQCERILDGDDDLACKLMG